MQRTAIVDKAFLGLQCSNISLQSEMCLPLVDNLITTPRIQEHDSEFSGKVLCGPEASDLWS